MLRLTAPPASCWALVTTATWPWLDVISPVLSLGGGVGAVGELPPPPHALLEIVSGTPPSMAKREPSTKSRRSTLGFRIESFFIGTSAAADGAIGVPRAPAGTYGSRWSRREPASRGRKCRGSCVPDRLC